MHLTLILVCISAFSQNTWVVKRNFPGTAREGAVSFVIGNYAYVGLGYDGTSVKKDFWCYNPSNNTWNKVADFGGLARQSAVVFVINDTAYVGTGDSGYPSYAKYKDFWKYDPASNIWTRKADFSGTARTGAIAFAIGNKGFVGTGEDATDCQKDFWEYTPATNQWLQKADFGSDKRKNATAFEINGKGYVCSGWYIIPSTFILSDIQEYNPINDSWTEKIFADGSLNKKQYSKCFVLNNKAYLISGNNTNSVVVYDPATNVLSDETNFGPAGETQRSNTIAFAVGSKGYAGLGSVMVSISNITYKNDVWFFNISLPPAPPENLILTPLDNQQIDLKWTDKSDNETGFVVERSLGNNMNYQVLDTVNSNSTSFSCFGLIDSTKYYFRIKAINAVGNSTYIEAFNSTLALHPPKTPTNLKINYCAATDFSVTWTDNATNETNFVIEYSVGDSLHYTKIDSTGANRNLIFFNSVVINDSSIYFVRVKAKNAAGYSTYSNQLKVITKAGMPNDMNAEPYSSHQINIFWKDYSHTETGYIIERSDGDSLHFTKIDSIGANIGYSYYYVKYTDRKVVGGIKYYYRIAAIIKGKRIYCPYFDRAIAIEAGGWFQLKNYPGTRADGGLGFYNDSTFYMGLGWYEGNKFWAYSLKTASWTEKSQLEGGKTWDEATYMVLNGKGFVCLGNFNMSERKRAWAYDFTTNTWSQKKDVPLEDRYAHSAFVINNKGYIIGGFNSQTYKSIKNFWQYDLSTDTWTQLKDFPGDSCFNDPVFVYNNKAYMLHKAIEIWEYNPVSDTWTKNRNLKQKIYGYQGLNLNERFFVFSNKTEKQSWGDLISIYEYNFLKDSVFKCTYFPGKADRELIFLKSESQLIVGCGGGNGYSDEVWTYNPNVPSAPAQLVAKPVTATKINLTWTDDSDVETNYVIERGDNSNITFHVIDTVGKNVTTYTDLSISKEQKYYYRVRSFNNAGFSPYSNTAACSNRKPDKPTISSIYTTLGADSVFVFYYRNYNDIIDGYVVERLNETNNNFEILDTLFFDSYRFIDKKLKIGKTYQYRIKDYNSLGSSDYSDTVKVIPGSLYLGGYTNNLKVDDVYFFDSYGYNTSYNDGGNDYFSQSTYFPIKEGDKLLLNFQDFNIYKKDTLFVYDGTTINSPIIGNYTSKNRPSSFICAKNQQGALTFKFIMKSNYSSVRYDGWKGRLRSTSFPPPTNLTANKGSKIVLNWIDNSDTETNFVIERSQADTSHFTELSNVNPNITNFSDSTITSNLIYYYRVKAVFGNDKSEYTNIATSNGTILAIEQSNQGARFKLFPNPAANYCSIGINSDKSEIITVNVINLAGKVLQTNSFKIVAGYSEIPMEIENLSAGIYCVRINSSSGVEVKTLVIQN